MDAVAFAEGMIEGSGKAMDHVMFGRRLRNAVRANRITERLLVIQVIESVAGGKGCLLVSHTDAHGRADIISKR